MTTNTQTEDLHAIPDALKRTVAGDAAKKASNGVTVARTATPPVETKTRQAKAAKPATVKAAAKAKPAKEAKTHKPSTIVRTADNPIKSIVPAAFKKAYAPHNDTCGDELSLTLKVATTGKNKQGRDFLDLSLVKAVGKANGIDMASYAHLNNGQQRMILRNKLAGMLRSGTAITVGKRRFADAEKALRKPVAVEQQVAA